MSSIKNTLKSFPLVVTLKRFIWNTFNIHRARGASKIDVNAAFPLFQAAGLGVYSTKAKLTMQSINETIPLLREMVSMLGIHIPPVINLDEWETSEKGKQTAEKLRALFSQYGSDKASTHNYYLLYGEILANGGERVLEIGLGTNNPAVVSHMGNIGHPGSSLRAFRDLLPNATIYGADVDKGILFTEDRIETHWVDQVDEVAMDALANTLPNEFDLIIDDGLHSPNANLRTLSFALPKAKVGGWVVIEDIVPEAIPLWEVVSVLLPEKFEGRVYKTKDIMLFAVKRLS